MKKCIIVAMIMVMLSGVVPANAGWINGDEALGGFSYMMESAYENKMPNEPYRTMFYRAYMMFHYEYTISDEAREVLCRIVEAEATSGNMIQKMNVASCVLARVESSDWPDTIEEVVFDNDGKTWQFSPVSDGRYYTVPITDSTIEAVDKVLKNGKTHDCLWFCSDGSYNKKDSWHRNHLKWAFFDGEHHYFY